ncbi:MAG: hypothetical protein C4312_05375, partial [Thermoflexus sp.]
MACVTLDGEGYREEVRMRARFWAGGGLLLVAVALLIVNGVRSASQYYLTVSELRARAAALQGRPIRLSGI